MKLLEHLLVALRNFRGYDCRVHPHGESVLTDCNNKGAYSPLRAFFMRNISMRSHLYGEAGEGHPRMCRFSNEPVDQPFSALPPSLGREWQGF